MGKRGALRKMKKKPRSKRERKMGKMEVQGGGWVMVRRNGDGG